MKLNKLNYINTNVWIFILSFILGWTAFRYFSHNQLIYTNFDALSRLNIARKIIDNLTPGMAQLGNVWLPLPQILMLPLVWIKPFWHNSLAGSLPQIFSFAGSCVYLYLLAGYVTQKKLVRFIGLAAFAGNINILLLQSMAMSESLFILLMVGATYHLMTWAKNRDSKQLLLGGFLTMLLTLVRYEAYAYFAASVMFVVLINLLDKTRRKSTIGITLFYTFIAGFGLVLWMGYLGAIFGDPLYWQKIYSHEKSIISTDVKLELQTFADQSSEKTGIEGNLLKSMWSYQSAVAYMSGIGLTFFAAVLLPIYLVKRKVWEYPEQLGFGLLLTSYAFIVFTLVNGGIPISMPDLTLNSITDYQTHFEFEYNIRYGLLTLPAVVMLLIWFMSWNRLALMTGTVLIVLHVLSPLQKQINLYYLLPVKWATGSATSNTEDKAVEWFRNNYTDGLILISALKHDPSMFKLGVDYKTYIHEGTGQYWLTSREKPEEYASWIYMNNLSDLMGGLSGAEDSVGKYLILFDDWREHYTERYRDDAIVIYQRTLDYLEENPSAAQAQINSQEYLRYKSIDIMQWSRDRFREREINGNPTDEQIAQVVAAAASMNPTHIAIGTPYDEEFIWYMKIWVDEIRKHNINVWFRGNFAGWEGWYDYEPNVTPQEHLEKTREFILTNPDLFEDGDSFSACPECENGNPGDPRETGDVVGHNQFLREQQLITKEAFDLIGKKVFTNWQSMNGDIAMDIIDAETVRALGNIITIDHYVSAPRMDQDIKFLKQKFPNVNIFIGEYGAELVAHGSEEKQLEQLEQMFQVLDNHKDTIIGFNYWSINRSSTALINDNYVLNRSGQFMRNKFGQQLVVGRVLDENNQPVAGAKVFSSKLTSVTTDSFGQFSVAAHYNQPILVIKPGFLRGYMVIDPKVYEREGEILFELNRFK